MTEVVGKCIFVDNEKMIILDDDNDNIEMVNIGLPEKVLEYFKTLINHRISYYYGKGSIEVRKIKANEKQIIHTFSSEKKYTVECFFKYIHGSRKG